MLMKMVKLKRALPKSSSIECMTCSAVPVAPIKLVLIQINMSSPRDLNRLLDHKQEDQHDFFQLYL